ncbi:S1 RNA-binding domain-containing protein, partial [Arthrobacter sp. 2YAF22_2]|uniref:S1 RNA-binding domain-containing protein n=1 Tax=Arthrobacter sp. 2YAF22_2 TaxID=3233029 RepID=UPI003F911868
VHQDGLVHVSALANRFVSDPREVVKSGQVVKVKVLEADPERKRISLTLRLDDEPAPVGAAGERPGRPPAGRPASGRPAPGGRTPARQPAQSKPVPAPVNTAMAEALRKAGLGK